MATTGKAASQQPSKVYTQAEVDQLIADNAALREQLSRRTTLGLKVGSKGTVSLTGINGPRPVSLYADQWDRVLAYGSVIDQFIADNEHMLARKDDTPAEAAAKQAARDAAGILRPEVAAAQYAARQQAAAQPEAPLVQGSAASRRPSRIVRK